MKIIQYTEVNPVIFDSGMAKGIAARVVIGKNDGADNFCMRIFEVSASGCSPRHSHEWEHEIFIHSGTGEVYNNGKWTPVKAGSIVFIPGNEEHQIRNAGSELLVFACLIPSNAPEL
ncbi:MAG: cupin domain-containing protein [Desulfobacteraceae bacterium]|nr:MAG: cupin domain-containing protein [Desulfobacteraceae bacterium]